MTKDADFSILIVGLGLIGGSLAQALAGFKHAAIYGVDTDETTLSQALSDGAIAGGYTDVTHAPLCDLVLVCLYPDQTVSIINSMPLKPGAVVSDVCGVKEAVTSRINSGIDFIGGHPMAGKECGGYQNASDDLFLGATYLLTPTPSTSPHAIALLRELAAYIGCQQVTVLTPQQHDEMTAFTSQLMHVVAAALCTDPQFASFAPFGAGSLRDCTRVGDINPTMWTALFLHNRAALLHAIALFEESMDRIKATVAAGDGAALSAILAQSAQSKRQHRPSDIRRIWEEEWA